MSSSGWFPSGWFPSGWFPSGWFPSSRAAPSAPPGRLIPLTASADTTILLPASLIMCQFRNFSAQAGEDLAFPITLSPLPAGGIASWTLQGLVVDRQGNVLLTLTLGNGLSITDGPNGRALMVWTAAQTGTTLGAGIFNYAVLRTDTGQATYLVRGQATLKGFLGSGTGQGGEPVGGFTGTLGG